MPGEGAICYIVGAGEFGEVFSPRDGDHVIAADGGYRHLRALGIEPDVLMGDMDSVGALPAGVLIERFPPEKDDTDMMIAIKAGLALGYSRFILLGALGGRFDHTFANIQSLLYIARRGGRGRIVGGRTAMTVIDGGTLHLAADRAGYVSVFALGGAAEGVSLRGLKYELEGATLLPDVPLGVSNEFIGRDAAISVRRGALLVTWRRAPGEPVR